MGFGPGLKRDGRWSKATLSAHLEGVTEITGVDIHPSYVLPRCSILKSTSSSFQELCLLSYHFVLNIRLRLVAAGTKPDSLTISTEHQVTRLA